MCKKDGICQHYQLLSSKLVFLKKEIRVKKDMEKNNSDSL